MRVPSAREADLASALARAEAENRDLRSRLERAGKSSMTADEASKRAKQLMKDIPTLLEKKDGRTLLRLMRELAALGEPGYAAALKIAEVLTRDAERGKGEFGVPAPQIYNAFRGPLIPMLAWALTHPGDASEWMRQHAVGPVMWAEDLDPRALFLEALQSETSAQVASSMAGALGELARGDDADALAAAALAQAGRPGVLSSIVDALAGLGSPEASRALNALAASTDPAVRAEAQFAKTRTDPPAPGILISGIVEKSQAEAAGLRRGDLIVAYNGESVGSFDALRQNVEKTSPDQLVPILVWRDGQSVPMQIRGNKIGIYGDAVVPRD
ncbi:MAG: PDZ domain-containing protein [Planctomycetes bacterium]|nr:PDZ domain-containing protein [Planctomycetota bacterium]